MGGAWRRPNRTSWLRATLAAGFALVLVHAGTVANAVTGGSADGAGHPYVAMILPTGATVPTCTGVLVTGPRGPVVLTAAHCLFRGGRRTGSGVRVSFAPQYSPAAVTFSGKFYISPLYDPARALTHDVAAIVLDQDPGLAPARLAAVGTTANYRGDVVTVGTGQPHQGVRRTATETIVGRDGQWLDLRPDSGNSCDGDSGGPDLLPGTDDVVALTDQGSCSTDRDQRVDTVEVYQFISSAVAWPTHPPLVLTHTVQQVQGRGTTVRLLVHVSPLYAQETALRQELLSGRWVTLDAGTVDAAGMAHFSFRPVRGRTTLVRVLLPRAAAHPAGMSGAWRVSVR